MTDEKVDVNSMLKTISEKLKVDESKVKETYEENITKMKELFPGLADEEYQKRAINSTVRAFKRIMRSDAVYFEGVVYMSEPTRDLGASRVKKIQQMYKENPQKMIKEGVVNQDGVPLDNRKKIFEGTQYEQDNPSYGQPLPEHSYSRRVTGIASKDGKEKPTRFFMQLQEGYCKLKTPAFVPVKFRAAVKRTDDDGTLILAPRQITEFTPIDKDINMVKDVIEPFIKDKVEIPKLKQWIADTAGQYKIPCVVGYVTAVNPGAFGKPNIKVVPATNLSDLNKELELDPETGDPTGEELHVTLTPEQFNAMDFTVDSKVYVIGSPWVFKRDNGPEMLGVTCYAYYAPEDEKVPIGDKPEPINRDNMGSKEQAGQEDEVIDDKDW